MKRGRPRKRNATFSKVLPINDIWIHHIFPYLDRPTQVAARRVAYLWKQELESDAYKCNCKFVLGGLNQTGFQRFCVLYRPTSIEVDIKIAEKVYLTEFAASWLAPAVRYLKHLDLTHCYYSGLHIVLPQMRVLEELDLSLATPQEREKSPALEVPPSVRVLELGNHQLLRAKQARKLTRLQELNVHCNNRTSSKTFGHLTSLQHLSSHASRLRGEDLAKLTNLETLSLSFIHSGGDSIRDMHLRKLTKLRTLDCNMTPSIRGHCLPHLPRLEWLGLGPWMSSVFGRQNVPLARFAYEHLLGHPSLDTVLLTHHFSRNETDFEALLPALHAEGRVALKIVHHGPNPFQHRLERQWKTLRGELLEEDM